MKCLRWGRRFNSIAIIKTTRRDINPPGIRGVVRPRVCHLETFSYAINVREECRKVQWVPSKGLLHWVETGIVPGKRSPRLFFLPSSTADACQGQAGRRDLTVTVTNKRVSLCSYTNPYSILVLLTATLSRFQSITYHRNSFLMTFRTLEGITREYVTLTFY